MIEQTISVVDARNLLRLFGPRDKHLRAIRQALGVRIWARDGQIRITGSPEAVAQATRVFEQLQQELHRTGHLSAEQVAGAIARAGSAEPAWDAVEIPVMQPGRIVRPMTPGQRRYIEAIRKHDIVFCVGPAGTGKTYLAVAMAVTSLKSALVRKIVLVRPAVEAGESLGYLPGDMHAKINPYLRPLLDALREMMDYDQIRRHMDQDLIEVIPLAYMRGRTLNEAFIILDEAQNTTVGQMKMFLTRMGRQAKVVISGDVTQTDLPPGKQSGLADALVRLRGIPGIAQVRLQNEDIVRNPLVNRIVEAYHQDRSGKEPRSLEHGRGSLSSPSWQPESEAQET